MQPTDPARAVDLLERNALLARLNEVFARVARGSQGACVLVHGEAGIGKTSLLQRFAGSLDKASASVLVAGCEALLTPRPLGPLVDLADRLPPSVSLALHEGRTYNGVFPALLAWLRASTPPVVLVIEDMHWADDATLDCVRYIGRRLHDAATLLLLSYRSDELDTTHPLRRVLGDMPSATTMRIAVPALSAGAVTALARRAERSVQGVFEATGGNPFYVTELLSSVEPGVPPSVTDAVLARLARLSEAARELAELVSTFPGHAEQALLHAIAQPPPAALDQCVHHGLLVASGDALAFRHELAREAVHRALPATRRAALHAAVFHALDAGAGSLERRVHHAEGAGLSGEVIKLAPRAAQQASASGAHRDAKRLYALALRHGVALDAAERAPLLEAHALECMLTSLHHAAIDSRREALILRRQLGDATGEGINLRWLARLHVLAESSAAAFDYARRSIEVLQPLPASGELAIAYSTLSHLHLLCNDVRQAEVWGVKAIDLAASLGSAEPLAHALNTVATARLRRHDDGKAWPLLERSLELALASGLDADAARAYNNLYIMSLVHRDFARAAGHAERGIAFCEAKGIDVYTVRLRIRRAYAAIQTGDWDGADAELKDIVERHSPSPMEQATHAFVAGLLDLRRGRPQAHDRLAIAIESMRQLGVRIWFTSIAAASAESAWLRGDTRAAAFGPLLEEANAVGDAWQCGELAAWCARLGRPRPVPLVEAAFPYALELSGRQRDAAEAWSSLGCPYERALALAGGDEADLRAALAVFERLGAAPAAELTRRRLYLIGVRGLPRGPQPRTRDDPLGLTGRERAVFELLRQGLSNAQMAARLHRSARTVEHHVAAVFAKTGVSSRAELVAGFGPSGAPKDK